MKNIVKLISISSIAAMSLVFGQAYASEPFTMLDLGQSSTPANPLAFYCAITGANPTDKVAMNNGAVMITGFQPHGELETTVQQINSVYFNSYHDPNTKYTGINGMLFATVGNSKAVITCVKDSAGTGRTLMPGNYGVVTP